MNHRRRMPDLSYLNVKPEAEEAYDELNRALNYERGNCYRNPGPWTEFSDERPTVEPVVAAVLCFNCPVLEQCRKFARLEQPEGPIVQGGEFYPETQLEEDNAEDAH